VVDDAVDAGDEELFADEEEVRVVADLRVVPEDVLDVDAVGLSDGSDVVPRLNGVDDERRLGLGGRFGGGLGRRRGLLCHLLWLRLWVDDVDARGGGEDDGRAQVAGGGALSHSGLGGSVGRDEGTSHPPQDPRRGQGHRDEGQEEKDSVQVVPSVFS